MRSDIKNRSAVTEHNRISEAFICKPHFGAQVKDQ